MLSSAVVDGPNIPFFQQNRQRAPQKIRAVSPDILHFRAGVLCGYGQGLLHGQPLNPETVSAVVHTRHSIAEVGTLTSTPVTMLKGSG